MNWSYISGFFDADGYITMSRMKPNENEIPVLGLTNTKLELLDQMSEFIEQQTGAKGIICIKQARGANHQIGYDLKYVGFAKIGGILCYLRPLHPKKVGRLALLAQIQQLTPRNGKYKEEELNKRKQLVADLLGIK